MYFLRIRRFTDSQGHECSVYTLTFFLQETVINRKALRGKREKIDRRFLTLVAYSFSLADPGCLSCELHLAKIGAAIP